jgi:hypothetical protein
VFLERENFFPDNNDHSVSSSSESSQRTTQLFLLFERHPKLSSLGHCENTAIVLDGDDLSDSDGTIPPSQQSNASIETISPFPTPTKHDPIKDQRSNGDTGVSS